MPVLSNPKHERFAQERAKGKPVDEAYVAAGYASNRGNAGRLNTNEAVLKRIEEIGAKAADNVGATVERILQELTAIAYADITEAVDWGDAIVVTPEDGGDSVLVQGVAIIPAKDLSKRVSAAISEVSQTKDGIKIKFHSKTAALEMLGRHRKMFTDKTELTGKDGGPVQTEEVSDATRARALAAFIAKTKAG